MKLPPEEIECEAVRAFAAGKDLEVHHIGSSGGDEGIQHFYRLTGLDAPTPGRVGSLNGTLMWEHEDPEAFAENYARWDAERPAIHRHLSALDGD